MSEGAQEHTQQEGGGDGEEGGGGGGGGEEQQQHCAASVNTYYGLLQPILSKAKRSEEYDYLAGGPSLDEGEVYIRPYELLRQACQEVIDEIDFLKTHQHVWSEESFCIHCGNDGWA